MLKIKKGTSSYACHAKARFNSLRRTKIGQQNACSKERLRTQARFLIHVKLNIACACYILWICCSDFCAFPCDSYSLKNH